MPNWCQNYLSVSITDQTTIDNLNDFISFNESDESKLDFNKLIPIPEEIRNTNSPNNSETKQELIDKYGVDNWYEWCVQNWGTKWNAKSDMIVEKNDTSIKYMFDTAWAPPIPWIMKLIDKYPNFDINLEYEEPMMNFGGKIEFNNGEINIIEYELSVYIWENCNKTYVYEVIDRYLSNSNVDLNSDLDSYVEDIIEEIQNEIDNAYYISEYIKDVMVSILNNQIEEENISKLNYDNNGDEITDLSL